MKKFIAATALATLFAAAPALAQSPEGATSETPRARATTTLSPAALGRAVKRTRRSHPRRRLFPWTRSLLLTFRRRQEPAAVQAGPLVRKIQIRRQAYLRISG